MGASSPLILSVTTVCALLGIVLVVVAFGTDNWTSYQVEREKMIRAMQRNDTIPTSLRKFRTDPLFYSRTYGFFQTCFPDAVPGDSDSFTSMLGSSCISRMNHKDYLPSKEQFVDYSNDRSTRLYLLWAVLLFYCVGLFFLLVCLITGIVGCWRRSTALILTTGLMLLFATLFLAASMACWHGVDYLEREVLKDNLFYLGWHPLLREMTTIAYGWSYYVSWAGIAFILIASVLMLVAYRAMKTEEYEEYEAQAAGYMMPSYGDKGAAVVPYQQQQSYGTYAGYGYPAYYAQYSAPTAYPYALYSNR